MLPPSDKLSICFAHVDYRLHERFPPSTPASAASRCAIWRAWRSCVGEAHVLVISGLWQNSLLDRAKKLRPDSPLEQAGFEPSVSRSTERTSAAASDLQEETRRHRINQDE